MEKYGKIWKYMEKYRLKKNMARAELFYFSGFNIE